MLCGLCEGYRMRIFLLQQQIKKLEERVKEIQRINNTLLNTLKNCQTNENWKVNCQSLQAENHELKSRLNIMQKSLQEKESSHPNTPSKTMIVKNPHYSNSKPLFSYQTPKSQNKRWSSQKMSNFMSTMKKKKYEKLDPAKSTCENSKVSGITFCMKTPEKIKIKEKQLKFFDSRENMDLRKYQKSSFKNNSNIQKLNQMFRQECKGKNHNYKQKTFIEILVFE